MDGRAPQAAGFELRIKAVPGARRDEIAGPLGDRLKVRVSAPPEGGKANRAISATIARALGLRERNVEIIGGHGSPEKRVRVMGIDEATALRRLGVADPGIRRGLSRA